MKHAPIEVVEEFQLGQHLLCTHQPLEDHPEEMSMPRRSRICIAGYPLHVMQRGANRADCFTCDRDRRTYRRGRRGPRAATATLSIVRSQRRSHGDPERMQRVIEERVGFVEEEDGILAGSGAEDRGDARAAARS